MKNIIVKIVSFIDRNYNIIFNRNSVGIIKEGFNYKYNHIIKDYKGIFLYRSLGNRYIKKLKKN
jgi:hypothetical protein